MNFNRINKITVFAFVFAFLLTACEDGKFTIKGRGALQTETRSITTFTDLVVDDDITVYLTGSTDAEIEIKAQSNILEILSATVTDGQLVISFTEPVRMHDGVFVYVPAAGLRKIILKGDGNIENEAPFATGFLDLEIAVGGTGDIKLDNFTSQALTSKISGTGNITLSTEMTVNTHDIIISGSGSLFSYDMSTTTTDITILSGGKGSCEVNVIDGLFANIAGSGNVYYKGAAAVQRSGNGGGQVINSN